MKSNAEAKENSQVDLEEHKEIINRYLQMSGFSLKSLTVTHNSTGQVFVT